MLEKNTKKSSNETSMISKWNQHDFELGVFTRLRRNQKCKNAQLFPERTPFHSFKTCSFKNDISTIFDVPEPEAENGKALFFCRKAFSFIFRNRKC